MGAQAYKVIRLLPKQLVVQAASIYAAGDLLHDSLLTLSNALQKERHSGKIVGVSVTDKAGQNAALTIEFFSRSVTGTFTANAAPTIADADLANFLGRVSVAAADYKAYADNSVASVQCNVPVASNVSSGEPSRDLYMMVLSQGTPTYASTSDISVNIFLEQD